MAVNKKSGETTAKAKSAARDEEIAERLAADREFMRAAILLARGAEMAGEVPVGALVIAADGKVVGRGYNRTILDQDPTAHAEVVALREAAWKLGNHRLGGCALYVTIEPCAMCAGAMVQARIARLVYGADDPKAGAIRSILALADHPRLNHRFEVTPGILSQECGEVLSRFFQSRREREAGEGEPNLS
jgi:tRNA(adenine34) deaminase